MKKLRYQLVDVFTDRAFGGNPLAVFPDARDLTPTQMQAIARELNLSETAFVLPPTDSRNDYRVRIFTPAVELPMAGHPTIGTAFVLALEDMIGCCEAVTTLQLEEGVGVIPVQITWHCDAPASIQMSQPLPIFGPQFTDVGVIAAMLSIEERAIRETELPMEVVSCGVPFLFVPVRRLQDAQRIQFRRDVWERTLKDFVAPHVFVFTPETENRVATIHSRMFAPAMGISEDPATGAASGPLGCYLVRHKVIVAAANGAIEFVSEQGIEIGRPSFIRVRIDLHAQEIVGVSVGGTCYSVGQGYLYVD
jgi:trans-2,3-dihydro-3-hydroxyanthranilate isomerase